MYYIEKTGAFSKRNIIGRRVTFKIFQPDGIVANNTYPLLILNDGQESRAVKIKSTLEQLSGNGKIQPIIVAAIYAGERMQEYGIASQLDYAGRGSRAGKYTDFLLQEFIPVLTNRYPVEAQSVQNSIAGYSLGALSAFDIAWNNPEYFGAVGCFSGSFWWRWREWKRGCGHSADRFRIAHKMVRNTANIPQNLRFWFQAGTEDEKCDRNGNGIIDSIDDTLDLIKEINNHSIIDSDKIYYHQVEGGKHHPDTWATAMQDFLIWVYGK